MTIMGCPPDFDSAARTAEAGTRSIPAVHPRAYRNWALGLVVFGLWLTAAWTTLLGYEFVSILDRVVVSLDPTVVSLIDRLI